MNKLEEARAIINEVDAEMAKLFEKRMEAVAAVAEYKKENGMSILDSSREEEVVRRGAERISNELLRSYYVMYIKDNMKISRLYQKHLLEGMRVAYSGVKGAFAYFASDKLFPYAEKLGYPDFQAAYRAVENGECDCAVLPIENSSNGEVGQVTDLMFSGSLYVNDAIDLGVSHSLLVKKGTKSEDIKTVISHSQALGQCSEYIRSHNWQSIEYSNTALAAKYVSENAKNDTAAIACEEAAELFGLDVLEKNINTSRTNTTRFAVFSRAENKMISARMGANFILVFTVKNEARSLARAIDVIGNHGFNMRTLRSRPMKELLWKYYFYVECEGNIHSQQGDEMMKELSMYCDKLKLVGAYSQGE